MLILHVWGHNECLLNNDITVFYQCQLIDYSGALRFCSISIRKFVFGGNPQIIHKLTFTQEYLCFTQEMHALQADHHLPVSVDCVFFVLSLTFVKMFLWCDDYMCIWICGGAGSRGKAAQNSCIAWRRYPRRRARDLGVPLGGALQKFYAYLLSSLMQ